MMGRPARKKQTRQIWKLDRSPAAARRERKQSREDALCATEAPPSGTGSPDMALKHTRCETQA